MKLIPLSQSGKMAGLCSAVVDDVDYDWVNAVPWVVKVHSAAGNKLAYAFRIEQSNNVRRNIRMHRKIWEHHHGPIPAGMDIDHIKHGEWGGLDNRLGNLRLTSHQRNRANSRRYKNNTSGYRGAYWYKPYGTWKAQISINLKAKHLGFFPTALQAALAYDEKARELYGDGPHLNFPASHG